MSNDTPSPALTKSQIERGWHETFSTGNPYCPCDLKSFTKAVKWAERAILADRERRGAVPSDERAAFEAWYIKDAHRQGVEYDSIIDLREGNSYGEHRAMLNGKWIGWQARALIAGSAPPATTDDDAQDAKRYRQMLITSKADFQEMVRLAGMSHRYGGMSIGESLDLAMSKGRASTPAPTEPARAQGGDAVLVPRKALQSAMQHVPYLGETWRALNAANIAEASPAPTPAAPGERVAQPPDSLQVDAQWQAFCRSADYRQCLQWASSDEIPGALFVAFRAGLAITSTAT